MSKMTQGTILQGINNIFTVRIQEQRLLCRIKGKVLAGAENNYNPLAPGDQVVCSGDMILQRLPRRNNLFRWNRKRNNMQVVAANIDQIILFASVGQPPFRPRFIDRAIVLAEQCGVPCVIVVNKLDLGIEAAESRRIDIYRELGYPVLPISAATGEGMDELYQHCLHKRSVFYGQSGAGKSTAINALFPQAAQRTGDVSSKHNRGRHTTNYGRLLTWRELGSAADEAVELIDTPGIRELHLMGFSVAQIAAGYREILQLSHECGFNSCSHQHEPDCAVRRAVDAGAIHPDRYQSYLNSVQDTLALSRQFGTPEFEV